MTEHLKKYMECMGISDPNEVTCEITGKPSHLGGVDISHNIGRRMGGSDKVNYCGNLMALTREFHDFLERNPKYYFWFQHVHYAYSLTRIPYFRTYVSTKDPIFEHIVERLAEGKPGLEIIPKSDGVLFV